MTPERAAEIANQCVMLHTVDENTMRVISAHVIAETILYACKDQREACAKIAENMEPDDHGRLSVEDIAAAIRGGA